MPILVLKPRGTRLELRLPLLSLTLSAASFLAGCSRTSETKESGSPTAATAPLSNTPAAPQASLVGSGECAECHAERFESYQRTAHSRSLSLVDPAAEPPDAEFTHAASGRSYRVYRENGQLRHREWLTAGLGGAGDEGIPAQDDHALVYLVGSGRHSRTYLAVDDGFLIESPVTWYASRNAWALSPGYDRPQHPGFERPADMGCLVCHVGDASNIEGSYHRIEFHELAIGCERCHGPGASHVALHRNKTKVDVDAADGGLIDPARLPRELADDICAQCHLRGDATVYLPHKAFADFRPGDALTTVRIDYRETGPASPMKVVGHMDQMWLSRCYRESASLSCTTCHDMHPAAEPLSGSAAYRQKCLECHAPPDCGLAEQDAVRVAAADNCVSCHMPQTETDIPHIAFTHHRIGIHADTAASAESPTFSDLAPIRDVGDLSADVQDRCLGLAYAEFAEKQPTPQRRAACLARAAQLLEAAASRDPSDGEVWAALARIYWEDRPAMAIEAARRALQQPDLSPGARMNSEFALADSSLALRRPADALPAFKRLIRLRRNSEDWLLFGLCRRELSLPAANKALQRSLEISPFRPDLRGEIEQQ